MSTDKFDIDELFEGLKNLQNQPGEEEWNAILEKMEKEKQKPVIDLTDSLFASAFIEFEKPVTDQDFSAITKKIRTKNSKKIAFWFATFLIISLSFTLFFFGRNIFPNPEQSNSIKDVNNGLVSNSKPVKENSESNSVKKDNSIENNEGQNTIETQKSDLKTDNNLSNKTNRENVNSSKNNNFKDNISNSNISKSNSIKKSRSEKPNQDKTDFANASKVDNNANESSNLKNNISEKEKSSSDVSVLTQQKGLDAIDKNKIATDNTKEIIDLTVAGPATNDHAIAINDIEKLKDLTPVDTIIKPADTIKKGNPTPFKPYFTINATAGIAACFNVLNATNNYYLNIRQQQENAALLPSASINFNYHFNKHFSFGAGAGFTNYGYNANYNYTRRIYDSFPVYDTGHRFIGYFNKNYRDTIEKGKRHFRLNYFSIPINIGYGYKISNKIKGIIGLTGSANFLTGAKGNAIQPFGTLKLLDKDEFNNSIKKFNVTGSISAGVEIKLTDKLSFGTSLFFCRYASNIYKEGKSVSEIPFTTGINTSLIFRLP
ncbi:MAG: outer membrane beta-barrel protein [Bacteroidia bacterium]|nr:outer membrane beta-barrel protein [Bacteroidia bacterium]